MRGKALGVIFIASCFRITPAYAGKSCRPTGLPLRLQGSPPPMRGKVGSICVALIFIRITPAYAGKSRSMSAK